MAEKTLEDFIAKGNEKLSFEERALKFQRELEPLCKELGIIPWARLEYDQEGIVAVPQLKDLWDSGKE